MKLQGRDVLPKGLLGNRNQPLQIIPVSGQLGDDPIRNGSPATRQDNMQLNSSLATPRKEMHVSCRLFDA